MWSKQNKIVDVNSRFELATKSTLSGYLLRLFTSTSALGIIFHYLWMKECFFFLFLPTVEYYGWSLAEGYRRKGTLCVYGDSLAVSLSRSMQSRALCKTLYERCISSYNWIYPISEGRRKENDDLDFRPELVIENIHKVLKSSEMQTEGSLMILNIGVHYPQSVNFTTFQGLIRNLIHSLKKKENKMNHRAKIIWKTTTSIHREYFKKKNVTSWRFITAKVGEIPVQALNIRDL